MKKEIFYLIGAVAGALLVLLAVPLGNAYMVGWTPRAMYCLCRAR